MKIWKYRSKYRYARLRHSDPIKHTENLVEIRDLEATTLALQLQDLNARVEAGPGSAMFVPSFFSFSLVRKSHRFEDFYNATLEADLHMKLGGLNLSGDPKIQDSDMSTDGKPIYGFTEYSEYSSIYKL